MEYTSEYDFIGYVCEVTSGNILRDLDNITSIIYIFYTSNNTDIICMYFNFKHNMKVLVDVGFKYEFDEPFESINIPKHRTKITLKYTQPIGSDVIWIDSISSECLEYASEFTGRNVSFWMPRNKFINVAFTKIFRIEEKKIN